MHISDKTALAAWPSSKEPHLRHLGRLLQQRRTKPFALLLMASGVAFFLLHQLLPPEYSNRVTNHWPLPTPVPARRLDADSPSIPIPFDYQQGTARGDVCMERFSTKYLEEFRDHAVSYCPEGFTGNITCFHAHKRRDGLSDSMCFGSGVTFDSNLGKFSLDCAIRELSAEEKKHGLVPFNGIQSYWYETGPVDVLARGVNIHNSKFKRLAGREDIGKVTTSRHEESAAEDRPPKNFLLLKREGEANPWHCIMEIFSTWMTFDVLRMSADPSNNGAPFFKVPEDVADTQVVILDDRIDGPYFDLWTLFAGRKPIRLKELAANSQLTTAIHDANIIVPLAGSSNPLWKDDWEVEACETMPTISVFARRVLDFYEVPKPPQRKATDPIKVTFIDRTSTRRLLNQENLLEELKQKVPHIALTVVDFAAISFPEQLRLIRDTDVLVGVHGAAFVHGLFMRERAGAVVEIMPKSNNLRIFRNVARITGQDYYRVHAEQVVPTKGEGRKRSLQERGDWHFEDVLLETDRFIDVVGSAVKNLYTNGVWDYDVN